MNTLAFRRSWSAEKRYLVLIHNASAPDAAEWQAYVREMDRTLAEVLNDFREAEKELGRVRALQQLEDALLQSQR